MGCRVDQPRDIQCVNITQNRGNEVSIRPRLVPAYNWYYSWHNETQQGHQDMVIPVNKLGKLLSQITDYFYMKVKYSGG